MGMSENSVQGGERAGPGGRVDGRTGGAIPQFLVDLARNAPAMMWVFTFTTFLSALLLFAIQPMFAKMVLPVLGGSPSVWSVSIFFFQAALLAGYIYAHLLISKAPPYLTGIIHLGVCILSFICLPIGLSSWWGEPPPGEPYLWQLGMFTASIGLPFVAVSANAPLLQAWFARSGHPNARDPYFLYAASNLGSLIALLGYPFALEPAFGLSQLSYIWAYGFVALVISIATSFFLMRGAQAGGVPETPALPPGAEIAGAPPTLQERLGWIGLAFVPAAMVTAFTVHVTTDVASAPLLWVIPLALYLLTFVLVFRDNPLIARDSLLFLHLVALIVVLITLSQTRHDNWFVTSSTGVAVFFTTAMLAHRTLYEARPAPRYLTEFYLWMSFGGALGGMFTALVARAVGGLPPRRAQAAGRQGGQEGRADHLVADRRRRHPRHHVAADDGPEPAHAGGRVGNHAARGHGSGGHPDRLREVPAAPVRGRAHDRAGHHLAAVRRQSRRLAAELLRRLPRASVR
jgi:hypothetical protein